MCVAGLPLLFLEEHQDYWTEPSVLHRDLGMGGGITKTRNGFLGAWKQQKLAEKKPQKVQEKEKMCIVSERLTVVMDGTLAASRCTEALKWGLLPLGRLHFHVRSGSHATLSSRTEASSLAAGHL